MKKGGTCVLRHKNSAAHAVTLRYLGYTKGLTRELCAFLTAESAFNRGNDCRRRLVKVRCSKVVGCMEADRKVKS